MTASWRGFPAWRRTQGTSFHDRNQGKRAEKILHKPGLAPGEAFNMLLAQIEITAVCHQRRAATTWTAGETSKKSIFELKGLPTGQKVWVQMRACNARGKSPWSDPACTRVP